MHAVHPPPQNLVVFEPAHMCIIPAEEGPGSAWLTWHPWESINSFCPTATFSHIIWPQQAAHHMTSKEFQHLIKSGSTLHTGSLLQHWESEDQIYFRMHRSRNRRENNGLKYPASSGSVLLKSTAPWQKMAPLCQKDESVCRYVQLEPGWHFFFCTVF